MSNFIYANPSKDFKYAIGYVQWYENNWKSLAVSMFSNQYDPNMLLEIFNRLEREKFHFASRIRKTHHVNIPKDIIMMKARKFLRDIADDVIDKINPKQLEFKF